MSVNNAGLIRSLLCSASLFCAALLASPVVGAEQSADSKAASDTTVLIPVSDLEDIRRELQAVKAQNEMMREEIDIIHAEATRDWLTEQRSEEIKELVDFLGDEGLQSAPVLVKTKPNRGNNKHLADFLKVLNGLTNVLVA